MLKTILLTTGEVAEILKVSQQSIIRAIDRGILPGFRIPTHRRIPLDRLIEFMNTNNIPCYFVTDFVRGCSKKKVSMNAVLEITRNLGLPTKWLERIKLRNETIHQEIA